MAETPPTIVRTNIDGPGMKAAAALLDLLQAEMPEGTPPEHLLGSAYLCIRNAFAQHVRRAAPDVYLNACVAMSATEVFGQAERMTLGNQLPDDFRYIGIASIARTFVDRLTNALSQPPEISILSPHPAPRPEAS